MSTCYSLDVPSWGENAQQHPVVLVLSLEFEAGTVTKHLARPLQRICSKQIYLSVSLRTALASLNTDISLTVGHHILSHNIMKVCPPLSSELLYRGPQGVILGLYNHYASAVCGSLTCIQVELP